MKTAPLFDKLLDCTEKIVICQGGGDAAKTVSILQALTLETIYDAGSVTTVTADDRPNLVGGALRAFQKYVLKEPGISQMVLAYNKSSLTYTFRNGSIMEFKSFTDEEDAKGSERDRLFVNECTAIQYSMFFQLQRKTRKKVYLDYNPTSPFWVHTKILQHEEAYFRNKYKFLIVDHRHNPFLSKADHDMYESISDPELFSVYSRGKTGKIKGLIFGHFREIPYSSFPSIKRKGAPEGTDPALLYDRIIYGIDYGYTNDPTAIVKCVIQGRKRFYHELAYTPGISAQAIMDIIKADGWQPDDVIYSEAEPNMVNELRMKGLPVMPAIKGPGSIAAGISKVKEYECYYSSESINLKLEISKYKWVVASDISTGREVMTNVPVDDFNHLCDSIRYCTYTDSFRHRV